MNINLLSTFFSLNLHSIITINFAKGTTAQYNIHLSTHTVVSQFVNFRMKWKLTYGILINISNIHAKWYWFLMVTCHTKMTILYKTILAERFHIKVHVERKTMKNWVLQKITIKGGKCYKRKHTEKVLPEGLIPFAQWAELHFKFLSNVPL